MKYKRNAWEMTAQVALYLLLIILAIVTFYPMWHVLMASFSDGNRIVQHTGLLFAPTGWSTAAYEVVLQNSSIISGYINTIF